MTKKAHNQAVKLIRSMFVRMERIFESGMDWDRYIHILEAEQRDWRKFRTPVLCINHLGNKDSVRLFAVKEILEDFEPKAKDFFHIKHSCYGGYALRVEYHEAIQGQFTQEEREAFLALDYAQLNQEPSE